MQPNTQILRRKLKFISAFLIFLLTNIIVSFNNTYSQKKYEKRFARLPNEWKLALLSNYLADTNITLEYLFAEDTLFLNDKSLCNIDHLKLFPNIRYIDLANNNITSFPDNFEIYKYDYINLTNNYISLCKIIEIKYEYKRGEIFYQQQFNNVYIKHNHELDSIIPQETDFIWWQQLDIKWKKLFEKNANLYIQDYNNIRPDELTNILNLNVFCCHNAKLEDIKPLEKLKNIVILECSNNNIKDLTPLANMKKLGVINCSKNKLRDIKPLANLTHLEVIYIANNQIQNIDIIENLANLEYLDCSKNQITDMNIISKLLKINTLIIAYNPIYNINFTENMPTLQNLIISDYKDNKKYNFYVTELDKGKSAAFIVFAFSGLTVLHFLIR